MPKAATFDDELGYAPATPRKSAPRKPRAAAAGKKKKGAGRPRFDMHRIARYGAIGMAATMALGIMVNALVLQKGRHPAPLFGKALIPAATQVAVPKPAPLPPVRAAQLEDATGAAPAATEKARKTNLAARDDAPGGDDAIGRLLAGGTAPAARSDSKAQGRDGGKTVIGVQRALTKLGFKVPTTGAAGPATRKAIEAFEKDRHIAVRGDIDRRLVKVLAAESGIKID